MGEQPRRVLFTIGSLAGGGAERQTLQYLEGLNRGRFAPQVYLTHGEGELLEQLPGDVPRTAFWDRHRAPRWNFPGRIHRWQVRDLARFLDEQRIDVLVSVTFQATLVAGPAVRRRPTPWFAIEMADPRLDLDNQVQRFRGIKRRLLARAYRRADRVLAVSRGVRDGLLAVYGCPGDRVVVLPNFIDLAAVQRRAAADGPELSPDRFHIATIGRLDPQKGQIYLLQAVKLLQQRPTFRNILLHLIGQGPLESPLRDFVRQHDLGAHVQFVGYLPDPLPYLRCCHLFCLPSLYEGLPLALLEAMACGVPVVATDCPSGPHEVLSGGACGRLVPSADPAALADAIIQAHQHRGGDVAMVQAAQQRVRTAYSAEVVLPRLERMLSTTVGGSGA